MDERGLNLLCFPYAGGGASAYATWQHALDERGVRVRVRPVQLPGREDRAGEPRFTDLAALAEDLDDRFDGELDEPHVLYGHSMGAVIAHALALRRQNRDAPLPQALVISGHRAPHVPPGRLLDPGLSDDELAERLVEIGGIPPLLRYRRTFLSALLPVVRDDLRLCASVVPLREEDALRVPVHLFAGLDDAVAPLAHVVAWSHHAAGGAGTHPLPGGHFFIQSHAGPRSSLTALPAARASTPGIPTGRAQDYDRAGSEMMVVEYADERLITVTGVAGVGKSHLAHIAAARAEPETGLVCHVVDVAGAADEDALWAALGATTRAEAAERIGAAHALILLDNCDPVVRPMASAVSALLRACPHLTVMATIRRSLDLRAEVLVVVPPLETGPGSAAEELFVSLVRPHYRSTVADAAGRRAVTQICAQVDGVPLAIALAAGAVSAQGPLPVLDRLRYGEYPDSWRLRDVPDRHRSAQQAVAWTDRFLSPADRALLTRLVECPSPMDIETIRAAAATAEAFAGLDSLLQQSLLIATEGPAGEPAFRVPHMVRVYYWRQPPDRPADPVLEAALYAALAGVLGQEPEADHGLTPRQNQIALLVAEGLTNRQIARRLAISEWTVINHLRVVMQKLECASRVHVVRAMRRQAEAARTPAGHVRPTGQ